MANANGGINPNNPTREQMQSFYSKIKSGEISRQRLQNFLNGGLGEFLQHITKVDVPGCEIFSARDAIEECNIEEKNPAFVKHFLGIIEERVKHVDLDIHVLEADVLCSSVIFQLQDKAEVSLSHVFYLAKQQAKGKRGPLLTDGKANIAFVRGTDGNLWCICLRWNLAKRWWQISATSVGSPSRWYAEGRAISCGQHKEVDLGTIFSRTAV